MKKNYFFKIILDSDITIILVFLFLLILGPVSLSRMKVTLMPSHIEPVLTIITDYYGMQPDIIEEIITSPIEGLLKEMRGVQDFYSFSYPGRSKIVVYLDKDEDVDRKAILIKDRVYHISKDFPPEVREPCIYRYDTDSRPVMVFSLVPYENVKVEELFKLVNNRLKQRIMSVQGVGNVEATGSPVLEYSVRQKYTDLTAMRLEHDRVFEELINRNFSTPVGRIEDGNLLYSVSLSSRYSSPEKIETDHFDIAGTVFKGEKLFTVNKRFREEDQVSFINNREVLTLYIFKKEHSNILEIEKGVKELLENWSSIFHYQEVYNQAKSFRRLLTQLISGVFAAAAGIFLVVLIFYRKVFYALLILTTIPLSLSGTVTVLNLFSKSINLMTLAGLICGLGIVVDNSVIFIHIFRFHYPGVGIEDALVRTVHSSNRAITASTLSTCAVFVPIFYMGGEGLSLYTDFALTVSLMLVFSFAVSMLFIPSVIRRTVKYFKIFNPEGSGERLFKRRCLKKRGSNENMLPSNMNHQENTEERCAQKMYSVYEKGASKTKGLCRRLRGKNLPLYLVKKTLQRPLIFVFLFFLLAGFSVFLFMDLEYQDISPVKEQSFEAYFEFNPGLSTAYKSEAMRSIGKKIMDMGIPGILVSTLKGTRVTFMLVPHSPVNLNIHKEAKLENYLQKWKRDDGFFFMKTGNGKRTSSINVYFFADNMERLNFLVDEFSGKISGFPDITQILKSYTKGSTEIEIIVDQEKMQSLGLDVTRVIRFLRYIYFQPVIMKHFDGERMVDVRGEIFTENMDKKNILQLRVMNDRGNFIPIGDFCSLKYSEGPSVISRKNARRYISLDIHYRQLKESEMITLLRNQLEKINFENDSFWEFSQEILERGKNRFEFLFALGLSLFLVYLILGIIMKSFSFPGVIMLMIPSVFVGSYIFLFLSGHPRSVPVHLAVIMLVGLSVNILVLLTDEFSSVSIRLSKYYYPGKINYNKETGSSLKDLKLEKVYKEGIIKKLLLLGLKRKMSLIYSTTLTTSVGLVFIFFLTTSANFFRVFTGVLFSGLLFSFLLCILIFPSYFFLIYYKGKNK